jgi:hypothetical protein
MKITLKNKGRRGGGGDEHIVITSLDHHVILSS